MNLRSLAERVLPHLSLAYLGCVAAFGLAVSLLAIRDHFTVPYMDDWRFLDHYQSMPFLDYLFTTQNGHHVPLTLALFALDYEFLGGRGRLLVGASLACVGLSIGFLYRIFRDHDGLSAPVSRMVFGFVCFSFLWAVSCHDLLWGLNHCNQQTVVLLILSLAILVRAKPTSSWASPGLAGLCAFFATFSWGIGVVTWAALIVVAVLRGFPWRVVSGLAAGGAATTVLRGLLIPPHPNISFARSFSLVLHEPFSLVEFAAALLGSAPARVVLSLGLGDRMPRSPEALDAWMAYGEDLYTGALGLGATGLVVFGALAVARWRKMAGPVPDTLAIGLMAFGITGALLVAFARLPFAGPGHAVAIRWIIWSGIFWIGAASAMVPRRGKRTAYQIALLGTVLLPVISACMIPALQDARALHEMRKRQASRLSLALLLDVRHDRLTRSVALDEPDLVYRVAGRLEQGGYHPFDDPRRFLLGAMLRERFVEAGTCSGRFAGTRAIPTTVPPAAEVRGSVVLTTEFPAPDFVVLADDAGVIHGLGDFAAAPPQPGGAHTETVAWAGFIVAYRPSSRYTAYAVLTEGGSACRLGSVP
jgi:hypothetical protein